MCCILHIIFTLFVPGVAIPVTILDDDAKESLATFLMNFNSGIVSLKVSLLFLYSKYFKNIFPYLIFQKSSEAL